MFKLVIYFSLFQVHFYLKCHLVLVFMDYRQLAGNLMASTLDCAEQIGSQHQASWVSWLQSKALQA